MTERHRFACASCGLEDESEWSPQDAMNEYLSTFAPEHVAERVAANDTMETICDECYQMIMARIREEAPELLRPEARGGR